MIDDSPSRFASAPAPTPAEPLPSPAIWLPMDDFGAEVAAGARLMLAPHADLKPLTSQATWTGDLDAWRHDALAAVDRVLAAPALKARAETAVPALWPIYDLDGPAAETVAAALAELVDALNARRVRVRIVIVAWHDDGEHGAAGASALLDRLLAPGQPGYGLATVFLVGGRDRANRVTTRAEAMAAAARLIQFTAVTGFAASPSDAARDLFHRGGAGAIDLDAWESLPVFAAFAAREIPAAQNAVDAELLAALAPVLTATAPDDWTPRDARPLELDPRLTHVTAAKGLPARAISLWRPLGEERRAAAAAIDAWAANAAAWLTSERADLAMRTHQIEDAVEANARAHRRQNQEENDAILNDDTLNGFCSLLERAIARRLGLLAAPPAAAPAIETPAAGPREAVAASVQRLEAVLRRRLNGRLLLVAILLVLGSVWTLPWLAVRQTGALATFGDSASLPAPLQAAARLIATAWAIAAPATFRALLIMQAVAATLVIAWAWALTLRARQELNLAWIGVRHAAHRWTKAAAAAVEAELRLACSLAEARATAELLADVNADRDALSAVRARLAARSTPAAPLPMDANKLTRAFRRTAPAKQWRDLPPDRLLDEMLAFARAEMGLPVAGGVGDVDAFLGAASSGQPGELEVLARLRWRPNRPAIWRSVAFAALPAGVVARAPMAALPAVIVPSLLTDRAIAVTALTGLAAADLIDREPAFVEEIRS